jgi:hypothetical protein
MKNSLKFYNMSEMPDLENFAKNLNKHFAGKELLKVNNSSGDGFYMLDESKERNAYSRCDSRLL